MDAFLSSVSLIAIAETGDKTQLLSMILAAKYRRFWPIFFGVLASTLVNHALSAWAGELLASTLHSNWVWIAPSVLFILIGLWALIPDKEPQAAKSESPYGPFVTSMCAFFVAEMGDKTQIATLTLGAQYGNVLIVTLGTTVGMLIANTPAILLGDKLLRKIPLQKIRLLASLLFVSFGLWTIAINLYAK